MNDFLFQNSIQSETKKLERKLDNFLSPKTIAVIGASRNKKKLGTAIIQNLLNYGYGGMIYPINLHAKQILHLKTYPTILDIEDTIDLAIISVPSQLVLSVMEECGRKGVKNIVIISAGFKEIGERGEKKEEQIQSLIEKYQFKILGPNCLGFINTLKNINATFAANTPVKGNIAFMSQSGALATSVLDLAEESNLGFSYFVSLGNKLNLNELDFLTIWKEDTKLKSIFAYLEDITLGKKFLALAREISYEKPIVVLKPGETAEAQKAISSHTGSLAGDYQAVKTGMKQSGVIQTTTIEEFFNFMLVFNNFPVSYGKNIAILTNAGGPAVITTEKLIQNGLKLANFSLKTVRKLHEELPSTVNIRDPLDVVGDALSDRYDNALMSLMDDDKVDTILVMLTPQFMTEIKKTAQVIVKHAKTKQKLILTSFIGGKNVEEGIQVLNKNKVAHFRYPSQAVELLAKLVHYQEWQKNTSKNITTPFVPTISTHDRIHVSEMLKDRKKEYLSDEQAYTISKMYGIPVVDYLLVKNTSQLHNVADILGFPVAMKISSPKLPHKTDSGSVLLDIQSHKELENGFESIMKEGRKHTSSDYINGVIVQKMLSKGLETIIGIKKDPNFGHLLMFGSGGIYTEVYKDVAFRLLPATVSELEALLFETKVYQILTGARGKTYQYQKLLDIFLRMQQLVMDFPKISEMDINPLLIGSDWVNAVDVKIKIG